jgi:hypothetical protein
MSKPQRKHPPTPLEAPSVPTAPAKKREVLYSGRAGDWDTWFGIGYSMESTPPPKKVTCNSPVKEEHPTEEKEGSGEWIPLIGPTIHILREQKKRIETGKDSTGKPIGTGRMEPEEKPEKKPKDIKKSD